MISIPDLRPFWYYSLYKPPFRVRSGEVALSYPRSWHTQEIYLSCVIVLGSPWDLVATYNWAYNPHIPSKWAYGGYPNNK